MSSATNGAYGNAKAAMNGEIGRIMTTTGTSEVRTAMDAVQNRVEQDAIHAARLKALSALTGRFGAYQIVGNSGDETGTYAPTDQ